MSPIATLTERIAHLAARSRATRRVDPRVPAHRYCGHAFEHRMVTASPLDGVRVVDMTGVGMGPMATQLLGDRAPT